MAGTRTRWLPISLGVALLGVAACGTTDWTAELESNLDGVLATEIAAIPDASGIQTWFCRRGSASDSVYSVRSFEGRLCDDESVAGLDMLGGAALLICWEPNPEDFRSSGCADRALPAYGMTQASYDRAGVVSQMQLTATEYAAAASGTLLYYEGVRTVFCELDPTLFGDDGVSIHTTWCGG